VNRKVHELRKPYKFIGFSIIVLKKHIKVTRCLSVMIEHLMNSYGFRSSWNSLFIQVIYLSYLSISLYIYLIYLSYLSMSDDRIIHKTLWIHRESGHHPNGKRFQHCKQNIHAEAEGNCIAPQETLWIHRKSYVGFGSSIGFDRFSIGCL